MKKPPPIVKGLFDDDDDDDDDNGSNLFDSKPKQTSLQGTFSSFTIYLLFVIIIIITVIIIILSSSHFTPEVGLGLTLGSVFACHLFKRRDLVCHTQSTPQLLGSAVA